MAAKKKAFELKKLSLSRETLLLLDTPNAFPRPEASDRSLSGVKRCVCCA